VPQGLQVDLNGDAVTVRYDPDSPPPQGTHQVDLSARMQDGQVLRLPLRVTVLDLDFARREKASK